MSNKNKTELPDYTASLADIIIAERLYLQKRREVNRITKEDAKETWGLAVSGGGVRSSIISLGFIRELMNRGFFRRFDYLSAVSSGAFVPAALASLLTGKKSPDGKFGVDAENSPFLPKIPENQKMFKGRPNATEQMQHLKRSRELIPKKNFAGINNLIGVWLGGWAFSTIVFFAVLSLVAAGLLAFMAGISNNIFLEVFLQGYYEQLANTTIWGRFLLFIDTISSAGALTWGCLEEENMPLLLFLFAQGIFFSVFYSEYLRGSVKSNDHQSIITKKAKRYLLVGIVFVSTVIFVAGLFRGSTTLQQLEIFPYFVYWIVFLFPLALAAGMLVGTHLMSVIYYQLKLRSANLEELKAALTVVKGMNILMLFGGLLLPPFVLSLLLIGGVLTLVVAFICFWIGVYWTFFHSRISREPKGPDGDMFHWGSNLMATTIICFSFAGISRLILLLVKGDPMMIYMVFLFALLLNIFLFFFSQANRSSLHNFLKIKIYSAFLITSGRNKKGGLENLRNDSLMRMQDLGEENFSGPYLIINTAINVHGSSEPDRRARRAYPFIFSKYYCGSEVTNYARTDVFQDGRTKLQDALTNSAAIVHSGMGIYNFWAQSFLITALNLRLGGWIQNPLYHFKGKPGKHINYAYRNLIKEFLGRFNERSRYINISNGVHSGDNFGLIPLIQRKLDNIVICDFTGQGQYLSLQKELSQTMALARRYGISNVDLNVKPIEATKNEEAQNQLYHNCIRIGKFNYRSGKEGHIFYVRAVLTNEVPKDILRYKEENKNFPFESLTKQSFEDDKFEAYQKFGEFLADQFLLELGDFSTEKSTDDGDEGEDKEALDKLRNTADLLEIRIAQLEQDIGHESFEEPLPEREDEEVWIFNERLEKLIKVVSDLVLITEESETKDDSEGLLSTRTTLVEKLGYLRLERAKMAAGSSKFQISKELEDTERELRAIEQKILDRESMDKISELKTSLSDILCDIKKP